MDTPDPHAALDPDPAVAREQARPDVARIALEAHHHSQDHDQAAGLAEALATFARWAALAQPPASPAEDTAAAPEARRRFYARVYLYAQEIAEIAHRALLVDLARPEERTPLWDEEERLKAYLDAHRGDAPRSEPRV